MELSKEQKQKLSTWVEDLKSGKFKQGTSGLYDSGNKREETFCCLGVLGITQLETEEEKEAFKQICIDEQHGYIYDISPDYTSDCIEKRVADKAYSVNLEEGFQELLAMLNDGATQQSLLYSSNLEEYFPKSSDNILDLVGKTGEVKLTFKQIANFIEKEYLL